MKAIDRLIQDLGAKYYKPINFKHGATGFKLRRKGYAIYFDSVSPLVTNIYERITIEPCEYSNGDKWIIYGPMIRQYIDGLMYAKNLSEARKKILTLIGIK